MVVKASRSLRASPTGIRRANRAVMVFATKIDLAAELEISRATVQNFFAGKAIGRENFHKICQTLKLPWHEIAELLDDVDEMPESFEKGLNDDGNRVFIQEVAPCVASSQLMQTDLMQLRQQIRGHVQQQCGSLRVLDMSQPRKLDDLYTEVRVLEKIRSRRRLSVADLVKAHVEAQDRPCLNGITSDSLPGHEAIARYSKLIILGKPGSGKTTFLKHLATQCIVGKLEGDRVPVFISLKDFADSASQISLLTYITQQFAAISLTTAQLISEALTQGRALLLLDGLDEVNAGDRTSVLHAIRQFLAQFHANRFVISCRIAAQDYVFEQFTEVELADFDDSQIASFVQKWFAAKDSLATDFLQAIAVNPPLCELATSPILLTLLCLFFEDSGRFPLQRSALYREALYVLMKTWDASRHLDRASLGNLSLKHQEELLSRIALLRFERGDYFFRQKEVEQSIWDYRRLVAQTTIEPDDIDLDGEAILKSFEADQGLLIEQARGIYSFSQCIFQEYLAASAIVHPAMGSEMPLQKLANQITHPRWHQVFLITIELLPHPDPLLHLMKQKIDCLAQDANLSAFLGWLTQKATAMAVPTTAAAMRAFYLELELGRFCDLDQGSRLLSDSLDADGALAAMLKMGGELDLDRRLAQLLTLAIAPHSESGSVNQRSQALLDALTATLDSAQQIDRALTSELQRLRSQWSEFAQTSDISQRDTRFQDGWRSARSTWVAQLRSALVRHRNLGHVWQFSLHEKMLLKQYYRANQLLLECLDLAGSVTQRSLQKSLLSLPSIDLNIPVKVARSRILQSSSLLEVASLSAKSDTK